MANWFCVSKKTVGKTLDKTSQLSSTAIKSMTTIFAEFNIIPFSMIQIHRSIIWFYISHSSILGKNDKAEPLK